MPTVELEPTIPASARPQTHALDRAATGIGPERITNGNRLYTYYTVMQGSVMWLVWCLLEQEKLSRMLVVYWGLYSIIPSAFVNQ
jgi:hypothetical protein